MYLFHKQVTYLKYYSIGKLFLSKIHTNDFTIALVFKYFENMLFT